jgi:ABC-type molybdate transport system substrate-binding protein
VLNSAENEASARGFLDFVTSATGQQILATHGFASPASSKSQARAN